MLRCLLPVDVTHRRYRKTQSRPRSTSLTASPAHALSQPSTVIRCRSRILTQRVATEARFIDQAAWRACSDEPNIPVGARVYAGLDLGATRDLSALVIVWQGGDGVFHVKPYCWLLGDMKERSEQDHAP